LTNQQLDNQLIYFR